MGRQRQRADEHEAAEHDAAAASSTRAQPGAAGNAALSDLARRGDGAAPQVFLSGLAGHAGNSVIARAVEGSEQDGGKKPEPGPADLPAGEYTVVVVGSPSPGEVRAKHPFQFADAAARPGGAARVWLVERTGYELAKVNLGDIESRAKGAPVFWITPETPLPVLLKKFPPKSIVGLHVYSHGVPALLTLRYGWPGIENYGLSVSDARSLTPEVFHPRSNITFDSCNTATDPSLFPEIPDDKRSLAAEVADATGQPVTAWVGRTSYRLVNKGTGGVIGSEIMSGGWRPDWGEVGSRFQGRAPRKTTTEPSKSAGDWSGPFRMTDKLPATRRFPVPDNGSVTVVIEAGSEHQSMQGAEITVFLHRVVGELGEILRSPHGAIVGKCAAITWSDLKSGEYYVGLHQRSDLEVAGTIAVTIH